MPADMCEVRAMIEIEQRRVLPASKVLLLIGPGGAGKSSLGLELAPLIGRDLIDLDAEFNRCIGNISVHIRDQGYARYKLANSMLATEIIENACNPMLLVTSSGFLTDDNPNEALVVNHRILTECSSICLLPSRDVEQAVRIIVGRQLARPFTGSRAREEQTIRRRLPEYAGLGDLLVFSTATSRDTANAIANRMVCIADVRSPP